MVPAENAFTKDSTVQVKNPHLEKMTSDYMYHIGFSSTDDLERLFGDVKFVIMGGSNSRIKKFAHKIAEAISEEVPDVSVVDMCSTDRYDMYKVGPVLTASHGMGMPSMSILLHEIVKLLHYAKAKGVVFIRIGTSGGLGVEPGTIVVTDKAVNGQFECIYRHCVLGKIEERESVFNKQLADEIASCWNESGIAIERGNTIATNDFYEEQGRLDGAICEYNEEQKLEYLNAAHAAGVRNIEMESLQFGALMQKLGLPAAMCAVTLLNRLLGDQVPASKELLCEYSDRPVRLMCYYIKKALKRGSAF